MDLSKLLPIIAPILQEGFDQILFPAISAEIGKIENQDEQMILNAFLPVIKQIVDAELAKLK